MSSPTCSPDETSYHDNRAMTKKGASGLVRGSTCKINLLTGNDVYEHGAHVVGRGWEMKIVCICYIYIYVYMYALR